jgi:hypothetical protein
MENINVKELEAHIENLKNSMAFINKSLDEFLVNASHHHPALVEEAIKDINQARQLTDHAEIMKIYKKYAEYNNK